MTTHLGRPEPLPYVDIEDIHILACDFGPGYFPSRDLWEAYAEEIAKDRRKPVSRKMFGLAIKEAGATPSTRLVDGSPVRHWLISRPMERRALEFLNGKDT